VLGGTLARAHARSVDPAVIAGYIGSNRSLARAIGAFALAYADQVESDFARMERAVRDGDVPIERGL
jgi:hypothetical protein